MLTYPDLETEEKFSYFFWRFKLKINPYFMFFTRFFLKGLGSF